MTEREKTAQRLKRAAKRSDKSLRALAGEIGVQYSTLSRYIRGDHAIPSDILAALCKALAISPNTALGIDPDSRTEQEIQREWEEDTCRVALQTFGKESQICMVFEEMAELQKELCKNLRDEPNCEHIIEEIADVEIMLEQMVQLYRCRDDVDDMRREKLKRLRGRMEKRG